MGYSYDEQDKAELFTGLDVQELVEVTTRLTDLLNEEVDYLESMRVTKAGELQAEKQALTQVLEAQKRLIETNPEWVEQLADQERQLIRDVADDLGGALARNIRLVAVAKAVNSRVVQAVMDTLQEKNSTGVYTKSGVAASAPQHGISLTLNQQA